jgi:hypothetical protein
VTRAMRLAQGPEASLIRASGSSERDPEDGADAGVSLMNAQVRQPARIGPSARPAERTETGRTPAPCHKPAGQERFSAGLRMATHSTWWVIGNACESMLPNNPQVRRVFYTLRDNLPGVERQMSVKRTCRIASIPRACPKALHFAVPPLSAASTRTRPHSQSTYVTCRCVHQAAASEVRAVPRSGRDGFVLPISVQPNRTVNCGSAMPKVVSATNHRLLKWRSASGPREGTTCRRRCAESRLRRGGAGRGPRPRRKERDRSTAVSTTGRPACTSEGCRQQPQGHEVARLRQQDDRFHPAARPHQK